MVGEREGPSLGEELLVGKDVGVTGGLLGFELGHEVGG